MKREELLNTIDAALVVERWDYARDTAQVLLDVWPNDLAALCGFARAIAPTRPMEAIARLRRVVAADGQDADAQAFLARLLADQGHPKEAELALAAALAVRPDDPGLQRGLEQWPAWLYPALRARRALETGDTVTAYQSLHALTEADDNDDMTSHPAPWLTLLEAAWRAARWTELRAIAARVRSQWTSAVLPDLLMGAVLMREGQHEQGMVLLHNAVARDPGGQVPVRIWGVGHPYRYLWPQPAVVEPPGPLPAEVAAVLGRNRLSDGVSRRPPVSDDEEAAPLGGADLPPPEPALEIRPRLRALHRISKPASTPRATSLTEEPSPESDEPERADQAAAEDAADVPTAASVDDDGRIAMESLQSNLTELAARVAGANGSPTTSVHIILSHYGELEMRYGAEAAAQLDSLLHRLGRATDADTGLMSEVVYVDRADSLRDYELKPLEHPAPESVKAMLAAIDANLATDGAVIASVLIVGDDGVIPFWRLPNPVEDTDPEILTDAPYAVAGGVDAGGLASSFEDKDALIGERVVGRFPQANLNELMGAIQNAIRAHRSQPQRGVRALWHSLMRVLLRRAPKPMESFGYTASVWRSAAEEVYSVIGASDALHTSPPATTASWRPDGIGPAGYAYFNLHGLEDAPCWYGQRDPSESMYPAFPIALRPEDVVNSGRAPRVVFSAACYGAHVAGKGAADSLALRFLSCGALGYVGSTGIAYGSVARPLVSADLLARHFWELVLSGYALGQALREAKRCYAVEMQRRVGYLDAEDHKTLISFVLYGDPTLYTESLKRKSLPKHLVGAEEDEIDFTLAARPEPAPATAVPNEVLQQVKGLVAPFLPGVHEAEISLAVTRAVLSQEGRGQGKLCPTTAAILTLRKEHQVEGARPWQQIARVTLTGKGQVVRMTVSK